MEPTLLDGDLILVRRADIMPWRKRRRDQEAVVRWRRRLRDISDDNDDNDEDYDPKADEDVREAIERQRIRAVDDSWECHYHSSLLFSPLPLLLSGDVAVFSSPSCYPPKLSVKRVISTGSQRVRPAGDLRCIESIPPDSTWMEGDNERNSDDSRKYGPVTKRLLVGKAERVIWPPSRWGRIERKKLAAGRMWSVDLDDDDDDYDEILL